MKARGLLALAALISLGGETQAHVESRRRCACCRMPGNRCPCRHCGACSTSGGNPDSDCTCGGAPKR